MDHAEYAFTFGMDDAEITRHLESETSGVLALADGDDAYAVPLAFVHRDGMLYFRLGIEADSRKMAYIERTDDACFVCYGTEGEESWSVIAEGPIEAASPSERSDFDETAINDRYPPLRVFDEELGDLDLDLYVLRPERTTGRRTAEAPDGQSDAGSVVDTGSDAGPPSRED